MENHLEIEETNYTVIAIQIILILIFVFISYLLVKYLIKKTK